jgi:apolipoprotein N-acyltransferase
LKIEAASGSLRGLNGSLSKLGERPRLALAVAAGLIWAAAFPRIGLAGLAWVAPGLLLFAACGSKSPFRIGYVGGLVYFLASLHWLLFIPVTFYPILGWLALCGFLALYPAAWCWFCARAAMALPERGQPCARAASDAAERTDATNGARRSRRSNVPCHKAIGLARTLWTILALKRPEGRAPGPPSADAPSWPDRLGWPLLCAAGWVAMEMVQARLLTGFPWNLLGVSQHQMLPLVQVASWAGVYGLSFLVAWFSVSVMLAVTQLARTPANRFAWLPDTMLPILAVTITCLAGLARMSAYAWPSRFLQVALVQPSIPQTMVWDSEKGAERFEQVLALSKLALATKPDLLIWPEAATPKLLRYDEDIHEAVTNLVCRHKVWLLLGADDAQPRGPKEADFYNSSFLVNPAGQIVATYRKRRLVMFGEYVPLARWLPFLKYVTPIPGGFQPGDRVVPFDLPPLHARTATLICFEDVFPHWVREYADPETDFLVNLTNDGWFRESAAQWQHAANAALRAVENGLPLVRCANNGLTCWIDPLGGMHEVYFGDSKDIYGAGFKTARIPLRAAGQPQPLTFYNRHGDWFGWGCVLVCALRLGFDLVLQRTLRKQTR